jgi:Delta3-Delta2-enoyl-CoA isomerase
MATPPPLFVLQVPTTSEQSTTTETRASSATISCHQASPQVYMLSFFSPPDNRLTSAFNATFLLALDILEYRFPKGVVISTSSISKFYSNGLNYETVVKDPSFFRSSLYPLWRRLLTFPMPTIALINGHAFAGGLMTAMMHDYRVMNPERGFLCLNELDFGAPLRPAMASIFRVKVARMATFREMVLESRRYPASEAMKEGIIDAVGGVEETLGLIEQRKLVQKGQSMSYGWIKEELYREVVADLDEGPDLVHLEAAKNSRASKRAADASERIESWEGRIARAQAKL